MSDSPSSLSLNPESNSSEPLYQVKLLSALRSGDPALIHPFLAEIGKDRRNSTEGGVFDTGAAALHLAIRCASVETIALLLSHRAISPNGVHPPGSGTTALHLAASLGRVDVVNLLLEQESIDDTKRDVQGRECKDVARGKDVIRAIDDSRSFLNASYRSLLRSYTLSQPNEQPSPLLIQLLQSPRIQFVDLSYLEDGSGLALLHEAAKRKDLRLIELAVRAGADVFVRNRKGKTAYEGSGKDDRVRVFLRQYANHDTTLIQSQAPISEPPSLKGYLNKYTNVAKGYNTRWFVLSQGVLSYYRHQEDETIASRGSISMRTCILKPSTTDQVRFEVHSTPSRGHQSIQKWYMKANHPVEASRWVNAIQKNVEWFRRDGGAAGGGQHGQGQHAQEGGADSPGGGGRRPSGESDHSAAGVSLTQTMGRKNTRPTTSSGIGISSAPGGKAATISGGKSAGAAGHKSSSSVSTGTLLNSKRGTKDLSGLGMGGGVGSGSGTFSNSNSGYGYTSHPNSHPSSSSHPNSHPGSGAGSMTDEMGYATTGTGSNSGSPTRAQHHTSGGEDPDSEHGNSNSNSNGHSHGPGLGLGGLGYGGGGVGGGSSSFVGSNYDLDREHNDGRNEHGDMDDASEDSGGGGERDVPSLATVELAGNSIAAQMELTIQLVGGVVVSSPGGTSSPSSPVSGSPTSQSPHQNQTQNQNQNQRHIHALKDSLVILHSTLTEYMHMVRVREDSWRIKMDRERRRQSVWEESLKVVVQEGEDLERELRRRRGRRGSRIISTTGGVPGVGGGTPWIPGMPIYDVPEGVMVDGEEERGKEREREGSWDLMQSTVKQRRQTLPSPASAPTHPTVQVDTMKVPGVVITQPTPTTSAAPSSFSTMPLGATKSTLARAPTRPVPAAPATPTSSSTPIPMTATPTSSRFQVKVKGGVIQDGNGGEEDEMDTDEEDEFFDAIESGNLPNLMVSDALMSTSPRTSGFFMSSACDAEGEGGEGGGGGLPSYAAPTTPGAAGVGGVVVRSGSSKFSIPERKSTLKPSSLSTMSTTTSTDPASQQFSLPLPSLTLISPYLPYLHHRSQLSLRSDERPSVSLWSVLKHSIGKDLTKITFPVSFNEPTSMLQRMAEDMEFSECLDAAVEERDALKRIAYVGAFAMSNYSSTIGRIAKPFNPMLSETFEYVRFDRQYCYLSEQVSHHPPISACWAESPTWHYYGEVDAQNKFMGKSFEIRPTGIAHADLLIPAEWGPKYPRAKGRGGDGRVVEHFSWKKVTTNVSGFILGSPTIDHYGDMVVTNHRTGDQCILTFKPRGWRGKDAYEISGQVLDSSGRVAYEIAGRWNSQLIARQVGKGSGFLNPDLSLPSSSTAASAVSTPPEYILLWRNSEKPSESPFNLTPFAISLNNCPASLKPLLCPTDCRLRPDQRAFEMGKYDLANELKGLQEDKQRSTRKRREEGVVGEHRPRWFMPRTDGDTGERVWAPVRNPEGRLEYWVERERVWKELEEKGGVGASAGAGAGVSPSAKGKGKNAVMLKWKDVEPIFIDEPEQIL